MSTNMNPHTFKSLVAHDAMPPALKSVALKARNLALVEARGNLLLRYDLGVRLRVVSEDEGQYTARGIQLLARYLGVPANEFYDLIAVVKAFTKEQVEAMADRRMSNGGHVTPGHLVAIARSSRAWRDDLVAAVFEESLTVRQLARLVREREAARRASLEAKRATRRSDT